MNNRDVAAVFETVADLLEIKGEAIYRVLAYRRAGEAIRSLGQDVHVLWEGGKLEEIPGVGKAISEKIDELLRTGKLGFYEKLAAEIPPGLVEVLRVGDVGPKRAARFWKELGITTIEELEEAARDGKLQQLSGMGQKSESRILESIEALRRRKTDRVSIGVAWPAAQELLRRLREVEGVHAAESAGSLRRWRETVGDLDLIVSSTRPSAVMQAFVEFPEVERVRGQGETKASIELRNGLRVQLWVHPPERYGSALQYATGSQAHNVRLRELALSKGLSLSEHGFKRSDGSEILCAGEEDVYRALDLPWIPPELREDRGELQAGRDGSLPDLVKLEDLRGEPHLHSDWSDGKATLEEMAGAAADLGMRYIVFSDHSRSLGVASGLSIDRLREQRAAIAAVQAKLGKRIKLLQGSEVEILADGRLDFPDEVLAELDLVIASLHTSLRQSSDRITARLLGAMDNPHVDMIGHPTGRLIGRREAADLDMDAILGKAAERGVALEINANPERLDLSDAHAKLALEWGCVLSINTDAHHPDDFALRIYGVGTARRAWASAEMVLNAWPLDRLLRWLEKRAP